ncbi:DNRLRE domain-containing protein [Termitidicoccus mucosus]|uniref:Uncharacterized protein n=1 Tax=Termitidicoccus mucosus TaxID=1184151 RepID=A0A178IGY0_9BACT|nr:hypothetical protein AW736_18945 [Opitutaceae bacterium TSB47]
MIPLRLCPSAARLLAALLALLPAAVAPTADAADTRTVTFQNGAGGYSGARETVIVFDKDSAADPQTLWIDREYKEKSNTLVTEKQALLRFSGLFGSAPGQISPGAAVTKAVLTLRTGKSKGANSTHRILFNRMLVPWNERASWDTQTWNSDGIQADGREAVSVTDALFVPHQIDTAYNIDVTASLRAWAAGAPNHGWVLRDVRDQLNPAGLVSSLVSTVSRRPLLTVTYEPVAIPVPSVTALSAVPAGPGAATLSLRPSGAIGGGKLTVVFQGRPASPAPDYKIALIPDTQYYTRPRFGGTTQMLVSQMDWLAANAKKLGIVCALQLGDISDTGDADENEWRNASKHGLYLLENPKTTGLPEGLPYSPAVGNHDQRYRNHNGEIVWDGPAKLYNKYFGVEHFQDKSYYGGHYGNDNNNHYMLVDAGAEKLILISLEFKRPSTDPGVLKWASALLDRHADRRAILVTHGALLPGIPGEFLADGAAAHKALRHHKNLMLIIGGHVTGEGRRTDVFEGATVHSILQDFQFDGKGGEGFLGLITCSPGQNKIRVQTYSPWTNTWRTDPDGDYTLDYDFGAARADFAELGRVNADDGATASFRWENLKPGSAFEWRAEVSNGKKSTLTEPQVFEASR